jgi:hypothetical protein
VARARRHVAIQRRVQGRIPGVPIFLIGVLSDRRRQPMRRPTIWLTAALA